MKKLIAMIGAFAMALGLYADASAKLATSFEANDAGISGEAPNVVFTPGTEAGQAADWSLTGDETTVPVLQYASETLPYVPETAMARRDTFFTDAEDNNNYLKLATGTEKLICTNEEGYVFLDQLVKFTGFDEAPVLPDDAKVAVWMSEYENDDESTETNLFVTCGKNLNGETTQVTLQIDGEYKLDTWYRLTIKSLGSIYGENPTDAPRAGFIIYINGEQVAAVSDDAKTLIEYTTEMTTTAKGYMGKKMLFPAIDATDVAFNAVAYQGMGAIDDVIFDNNGPEFAQKIPFEVGTAGGKLTIESVVDADGNEVDPTEGVPANTAVTVTYKAADGYKILGETDSVKETITDSGITIDPSDEIDVQEVVATVENSGETKDYAESELYALVTTGLVDGDVVTFNQDVVIKESESADPIYDFSENTTINVTVDGGAITWEVAVNNKGDGLEGSFTDNVGVEAGNVMIVTFESEDGIMSLNADVAGELTVNVGALSVDAEIGVAGKITTESESSAINGKVTLVGTGTFISVIDTFVDDEYIVGEDSAEVDVLPETPEAGWFTYQLKTSFTVTVNGGDNVEIVSIMNGEEQEEPEAGDYTVQAGATITVEYAPATGYEWAEPGEGGVRTAESADDSPIVPPAVKATEYTITIAEGGEDASADPDTYTIENFEGDADFTVTLNAGTAPTDMQFKAWTKDVDDTVATIEGNTLTILNGQLANITVTATWEAIPYVAQVGEAKFLTAAEALAKVQELEGQKAFPIVAKALDDNLAVVGPSGQQIVLEKDETITINANSWVFSSGVTITAGTPIALAADAAFTVVGQIANYKSLFSVPADYKVVEIDNANDTFTYKAVACDYVAQINDGAKFETLAEAFAAVQDDETIKLLASVTEGVLYEGAAKFTIDLNGQTWTWNGGQDGNWAALKVFGGDADITIVDGDEDGLGKMYAAGDGFCIWAKTGTVTINSGKFYNNSNDDYAIYVNGTAAVVINNGEFRNEMDAPYIWKGDLAKLNLNVENNNQVASITVNGGTFSAEPKDDSGVKFVAEGKKAVVNGGIWSIAEITYVTLTIKQVENCTIVVKNAEGQEVQTGAEFDVDDAAKLTVTRTPDSYYVLNGYESSEVITMDDDKEVTAAVAKETKLYYADLYVDGDKSQVPVQLGNGDHIYPWGESVPATHDGVMENPEFIPDADGTWYVSKLVLKGDEDQTWEFEYDGTTLTKKSGTDDVTIGAGNVLSYTVTTGHNACFGVVYLTKYDAPAPTPVIDPTSGETEAKGVKADDATTAEQMVIDAIKAPAGVDATAYKGYFTATAKAGEAAGTFDVEIKLSENVVKAEAETAVVAAELSDIAAAATDTDIVIPAKDVKPGLYYSLVEGRTLAGREEGDRTQATTEGVTLKATHYEGSGFYQIKVSASEK